MAPDGPVLAVRRGEPGMATFERLIASDLLDRSTADLLRIAARSRLKILIVGPAGSGKTALLAAMARDLAGVRVVTVARHRAFRWASPTKVELVASTGEGVVPYPSLVSASARLQPHLLVLDSIEQADVSSLTELVAPRFRGTVAALAPEALTIGLVRSADLVVRLGRAMDGLFRVVAVQDRAGAEIYPRRTAAPAFGEIVRAAGYGEALAHILG
jgi:pilus assembly protein CpaF